MYQSAWRVKNNIIRLGGALKADRIVLDVRAHSSPSAFAFI